MARQVYIYGFNELHRVVECKFLHEDAISIANINYIAGQFMMNQEVHKIVVIDNNYRLHRDFLDSVKSIDFVRHIEFEDLVSRGGHIWFSK